MRPFQSLKVQFVLVAAVCPFLVLACAGCDDDPVRPIETNTCWKPVMADPDSPQTHSTTAAWSPSGRFVAFLGTFDSCNNANLSLYITEIGGKSRRSLNIIGSVVKWLPPGDSVLIINEGLFIGGGLIKYNLNTLEKTPLGIQTRLPFFDVSDDGRYIYYEGPKIDSTSAGGIYRFDFTDSSVVAITPGGTPSVSPDGKFLALSKGPLFFYDLAADTIHRLSNEGTLPDWTPDGKLIVYRSIATAEINSSDLLGNITVLTEGFGAPNVSPNGNWILYDALSSDNYEHIWRRSMDGRVAYEYIK